MSSETNIVINKPTAISQYNAEMAADAFVRSLIAKTLPEPPRDVTGKFPEWLASWIAPRG